MKKIMKKNQIIITSLAILIAVAGYLNFADVDLGFKDKEASTDSSSILDDVDYDLTDETALLDENGADGTSQSEVMDTASPGEAVLTGASDFAAQAKVSREQVRSRYKADLQSDRTYGKRSCSRTSSGSKRLRECDRKPHRGDSRCGSARC